jgi:hypothetical protein
MRKEEYMDYEVVCVDHGLFPHGGSKIVRFGIRQGSEILVLEKLAVMHRMSRGDRFFVERGGQKAFLTTAISPQGNVFLQTEADETLLNNLLSLPVCTHNDRITYGTGVSDPDEVDAGFDGGDLNPGGGGGDIDVGSKDD